MAHRTVLLPLLLLFVGIGCSKGHEEDGGTDSTATADPKGSAFGYLYALQGSEGTFSNGELLMTGLADGAVFFAERPGRNAGTIGLEEFASYWKSEAGGAILSDDPPNAILNATLPEGGLQLAVIELKSIAIAGTEGRFGVTLLEGSIPATFASASLVIDTVVVKPQITD